MFGTLIESHPRPQRRRGSAMLSAIVHTALVAGAIGATTREPPSAPSPDLHPRTDPLVFVAPPTPGPTPTSPHGRSAPAGPRPPAPGAQPYVPIDLHGVTIPPLDPATPQPAVVFGRGHEALGGSYVGGGGEGHASGTGAYSPLQVDRAVSIVAAPRPTYPEMLRAANIEGRVVARFVVDTAGRVEPATIDIIDASHPLFERAVRDALPRYRFTAARVGDRTVRQLVEMPFAFTLARHAP